LQPQVVLVKPASRGKVVLARIGEPGPAVLPDARPPTHLNLPGGDGYAVQLRYRGRMHIDLFKTAAFKQILQDLQVHFMDGIERTEEDANSPSRKNPGPHV